MKKIASKIVVITLITIISAFIMSSSIYATNENIQIVKTEDKHIIYVKQEKNIQFKYATSNVKLEPEDVSLNYINSVKDGDDNNVALLEKTAKYLYIKNGENTSVVELNINDAIEKSEIAEVETTTNRIKTELLIDLEERNEVVDGVKYTQSVGGIKIIDDENAKYEYISIKLPSAKYTTLQEYANKLNEEYESKDMYSKIEFAKEFNKLYKELITEVTNKKMWQPVENMQIKQPADAQNNDKYVVLLKKEKDNSLEYDVKFMTSYRADKEESIPGRTETKVVQETAKLPVTGDSLLLIGIFAVIVILLIIVFIKIKNSSKKEGRH